MRLEKVFLSASFDGRQQMKFNMGGLVIGRTRGGQLKRSKGPLPAGWSVSVYPQNVATVKLYSSDKDKDRKKEEKN